MLTQEAHTLCDLALVTLKLVADRLTHGGKGLQPSHFPGTMAVPRQLYRANMNQGACVHANGAGLGWA